MLLNKTDLLKEGQLESLKAIVASLNPFATVCSSASFYIGDVTRQLHCKQHVVQQMLLVLLPF